VKFVGCGESHTIAVAKTGECYGWGNAHSGRLGILPAGFKPEDPNNINYSGIFDHVLVPQLIDRVRGVDTVACGSAHTLFALDDGRLFVTGCNISGQVIDPPLHLLTSPSLLLFLKHSWVLVIVSM
jgi:alpha-tubulin suppressor-like RCC1 family protein